MFMSRRVRNSRYARTTTKVSAKRVQDAERDTLGENFVNSTWRVSVPTDQTANLESTSEVVVDLEGTIRMVKLTGGSERGWQT
jgi:hypothetical protein